MADEQQYTEFTKEEITKEVARIVEFMQKHGLEPTLLTATGMIGVVICYFMECGVEKDNFLAVCDEFWDRFKSVPRYTPTS